MFLVLLVIPLIVKEERQNVQTEPLKAKFHTKLCIHLIKNYLGAQASDTVLVKGVTMMNTTESPYVEVRWGL